VIVLKDTMQKLLHLIEKKDQKKLLLLLVMMIAAALFETLGIGLIVPFVGIAAAPESIHQSEWLSSLYDGLGFQSDRAFLIFAVIILLTVFVIKNAYILLFQYAQNRVILNQQVKLSRMMFQVYLTKPYTFHLQHNSASLLRNINGEIYKVFQGIVMSLFQLLTELLVAACILALLITITATATLTVTALLGLSVLIFFTIFRKQISAKGKEQQLLNTEMIKWIKQGLGASKEVKVSGTENYFVNAYAKHSQLSANNNRYMKMLEQVPRLFIETLMVSLVLFMMLIIIFQGTNLTDFIATMALFTMAAFRLMPSINRIVNLLTTIRYSQPALQIIYNDITTSNELPINLANTQSYAPKTSCTSGNLFNDSIQLNDVSFRYPEQEHYSISKVTLTIPIGKSVAFIGESGAGKTTLVDMILGLLPPEHGDITVDGQDLQSMMPLWRKRIGYIPQFIYLSDDTIRANVAFGIEARLIDDNAVWASLEQAQLREVVEAMPDKLNTVVGERGVRLSGGQRQRIGIARALYHNPEILFMDEATSALDNETEKEVMKAIDGLKGQITLIIIAHRLTTIAGCDIVYHLKNGELHTMENKEVAVGQD